MYSWEIEQLLRLRNYLISNKEYFNIIDTSPQINHVKYDGWNKDYNIWTDDNYYFKFKVYKMGGQPEYKKSSLEHRD